MKNIFLITLAVGNFFTFFAITANAIPRPDAPKSKLTLTEAQIAAIKGERGRPAKDSSINLFYEDNTEQLEVLLQARLREVDNIIRLRDHTSLDRILTFSGLALQAWNPELHHTDTKMMIINNIINYGFVDGFIVPNMAMMDASYLIGNQDFGNSLNAMLAEVVPTIAENFKKQYGVPTEMNSKNFDQISKEGRNGMWVSLITLLDSDFFKVHNEIETNPSKEIPQPFYFVKNNDLKTKELEIDGFININIMGDKTAIGHFLKKIGKKDNSAAFFSKRKLFSSDLSDKTQCAMKCLNEIIDGAVNGEVSVKVVEKVKGKLPKSLGHAAIILGAAAGVDKCIASSECGGSKEQRAEEKRVKEEADKAAAAEKQKYVNQYNDMIKDEANKKIQEDLKDKERRKELEKKHKEYERLESEKDESEQSEQNQDEEEKPKWQENRDIKPMMVDDEGNQTSFQEKQRKKEMATLPTVPKEYD
jgi:hypothetical protein